MNSVQVNGVQYTDPVSSEPHVRHDRASVVDAALRILDDWGLAELTMRKLAAALDVQPSALYHHFANKQSLLAAVADRIQEAARPAPPPATPWYEATLAEAVNVRDSLLAYRDGAEVVLSTRALGLGSDAAHERLAAALRRGHDAETADLVATAILHLVLGDASLAQQRLQADSLGAAAPDVADASDPGLVFRLGVELLLSGLELAAQAAARPE